jgi:hypothetical protein
MATNMRNESVIEQWSTIVEGGAGHDKRIMGDVIKYITEAKIPHTTFERDECQMGMFGPTRDMLILKNEHLRAYRVFMGARDYGAALDVSWFLTYVPSGFRRKVTAQNLNLFTQQDLRAFASLSLHCMKSAIEELCEELQQSPPGLNSASTGFLQVW